MPLITDVGELRPTTAIKVRAFLKECNAKGVPYIIIETRRLPETQMLYYMQGRLDIKNNKNILAEYNALRKKYFLWEVAANAPIITWTLDSKHIDGRAIDIAPAKDGKPWWNADDATWYRLGMIGKNNGLVWGGDWPSPKNDKPHFEDV